MKGINYSPFPQGVEATPHGYYGQVVVETHGMLSGTIITSSTLSYEKLIDKKYKEETFLPGWVYWMALIIVMIIALSSCTNQPTMPINENIDDNCSDIQFIQQEWAFEGSKITNNSDIDIHLEKWTSIMKNDPKYLFGEAVLKPGRSVYCSIAPFDSFYVREFDCIKVY